MVPTKERAQSAVALVYEGEAVLFDCGENTQRQMKIANIPLPKVSTILISHWHGDHVLGLPGLLQSLSGHDYDKTLHIIGPRGTKKHMEHLLQAFIFDKSMISFEVHECEKGGIIRENPSYMISALPLDHKVPTIGFVFVEKDKRRIDMEKAKAYGIPNGPLLGDIQRGTPIIHGKRRILPEQVSYIVKGKKVAYVADTSMVKNCITLAKEADILICESTYDKALEDKAEEHHHLTAEQAGMIASQGKVGQLVLTHFSGRYKETDLLVEEAKLQFQDTIAARDFLRIKL